MFTPDQNKPMHAEKGLPDDQTLRDMAKVWLDLQATKWPNQAHVHLAGRTTDEAAAAMAESFKKRFGQVGPKVSAPEGTPTGLAYLRYSSDNSNPRSLPQQLKNVLAFANCKNHFIPWEHVYADAEVTGTTKRRNGYQASLQAIQSKDLEIGVYYADDNSRISRQTIEMTKMTHMVINLGKSLTCASDGTEVDETKGKVPAFVGSVMNEWFIDQLRTKVKRGMRDKFEQGGIVGNPSVGYKLVPLKDQNGELILSHKRTVERTRVIDECEANLVRQVFEWFTRDRLSFTEIARKLNELELCGKTKWTDRGVVNLLTRRTYIGVEIWGSTKIVRDAESGSIRQVPQKNDKCFERMVPELRIVDTETFEKAQKIITEIREKRKNKKATGKTTPENCRTGFHPKIMIRPICKHCNEPLVMGNTSKNSALKCKNGSKQRSKCKLKGYKSTRLIEKNIINLIRDKVITHEVVESIVKEANKFLIEEAQKSKTDLRPLSQKLEQIRKKHKTLVENLKTKTDCPQSLIDEVKYLEEEEKSIKAEIQRIQKLEAEPPKPIDINDVLPMLKDLGRLLSMKTGEASVTLGKILGPVYAEESDKNSRRGKAWKLSFTIDASQLMLIIGSKSETPTADTWEYLHTRGWSFSGIGEMSVVASEASLNNYYRDIAHNLVDSGHSISEVSRQLNITWVRAKHLADENHRYLQNNCSETEQDMRMQRLLTIGKEASELLAKNIDIKKVARMLKTRANIVEKALQVLKQEPKDRPNDQEKQA